VLALESVKELKQNADKHLLDSGKPFRLGVDSLRPPTAPAAVLSPRVSKMSLAFDLLRQPFQPIRYRRDSGTSCCEQPSRNRLLKFDESVPI